MSFDISGKIALISGGASGIGLSHAKELLRNGLRGVTLADVNDASGKQALEEIQKEFGANKAIYVQTDVTNKQSYEEAFKKTIEQFKNLDILINNAGIVNDALWEKQTEINFNGVVNGTLLGLEHYIPKYKTGEEGVIVNTASTSGIQENSMLPIYTGTKFAVVGMSKAFGDVAHYNRTKVRVLTICPGGTQTLIFTDFFNKVLSEAYLKMHGSISQREGIQKPQSVALAVVKIIKTAKTGTVWIAEGGKDPYEFILPPRESFAPK